MAVRSREELLNSLNAVVGEENNDDILAIIEDVTDTYDDLNARVGTAAEWEQKYHDNDAEWRQRYRERFTTPNPDADNEFKDKDINEQKDLPKTVVSYDDLFTVK